MNTKLYITTLLLLAGAMSCSCNKTPIHSGGTIDTIPSQQLPQVAYLTSDKSAYRPGEEVKFSSPAKTSGLGVRYWHLGELIGESALSDASSWTWNPPAEDYQGYLAELVGKDENGKIITLATCAVDVSSEWTRFPRYGYLGTFCDCNRIKREKVINNLTRHHINALQYYEWGYDHHHPLAGTPENPMKEWDKYLATSKCELEVIQGYISLGHERNIASMFYDLVNGVFEWCEKDGCGSTWYTYKDRNHQTKDYHPLDVPPFRSQLYLVDPNLDEWNDYFAKQISDVYKVFDFDGFHIDQLGNRGTVYDYYGNTVDLPEGYKKVISTMKKAEPNKYLAFNAVSEWGQDRIASAPVDILYNEVWEYDFSAFHTLLANNKKLNPSLNTVVCAYIHSTNEGYFNTPAVLMADAAIFSMGGAHLELGENLISNIYWPGCCLKVKPELEAALVKYYDFLVAYENILRDNVKECKLTVSSDDVQVCAWDAVLGKINAYTTQKSGKVMVHLHNYVNAAHMNWHDTQRNQTEPEEIKNFSITVPCLKAVNRVWAASPDYEACAPQELEYKLAEDGSTVTVKVPSLKYWTMIVIE